MSAVRLAAIPLLLVGVAAACSGDDDSGDRAPSRPAERLVAEELDPAATDFYDVPEPLPDGDHGDLVRYQLAADPPAGLTWYRVMYLSETLAGEPTVVTGVVSVPAGSPPEGGWPLASHAHGGNGIADDCAPSLAMDEGGLISVELEFVATLGTAQGFVVASTDYEGMGGPGDHPFVVGESEGRSVLDIARAARQIPDVEVGPTTAITGYSQGGHAALWASQIAEEWTPDLDVVGTMAGAPASEVAELDTGRPPEQQGLVWIPIVAGFAAAYPEADPASILTPAGLDVLDQLKAGCVGQPIIETTDPVTHADPRSTPPWPDLLEQNTPGGTAARSPVLVIHSTQDANVAIAHSEALLARQCDAGQVVERRVLPEGDHVAAAVPAYEQGFEWFTALASGSSPVSSCP